MTKKKPQNSTGQLRSLEDLNRTLEEYHNILENMFEGYYEIDLKGSFTFFNKVVPEIMGYGRDELMGLNNRQYTTESESKKVYAIFHDVYLTGKSKRMQEYEIITRDGRKKYIEASINLKKDNDGRSIGFYGTLEDVTERMVLEKKLRETTTLYSTVLNSMSEMIFLLNPDGKVRFINNAGRRHFDIGDNNVEGLDIDFRWYWCGESIEAVEGIIDRIRETRAVTNMDSQCGERFFELGFTPFFRDERLDSIICVARDITERKIHEEKLKEWAFIDDLTGVNSTRLLRHDLKNIIVRAKRDKSVVALLYFDADNLKQINDTYGHPVGDQYIMKIVETARESVRQTDQIYRMGGDEFLIICENIGSGAQKIVDKFCHNLRQKSLTAFGRPVPVSASMGFYTFSVDDGRPRDLDALAEYAIMQADLAMYNKKHVKKRNQQGGAEDPGNGG